MANARPPARPPARPVDFRRDAAPDSDEALGATEDWDYAEDIPDAPAPVDPFDDLAPRPPAWKVPPRPIPADDMPAKVMVEGPGGAWVQDVQFLHGGETVWLAPSVSMATMFTTAGLALYGAEGGREGSRRMVQSAEDLFTRLADCVADWDLTGLDGEPLPKPWKNPAAFKALTDDEIAWLVSHLTGQEPKADRGNGSRGSSSTIAGNRRRRPK